MLEICAICVTAVLCVWLASKAHIKITIERTGDDDFTTAPEELIDIDKVYDEMAKDGNPAPNFADVIKAINEDFGGIDYGDGK